MRDTVAMSSEHLDQEVVGIVRDWKNQAKRTQYKQRLQELGPTAIETLLVLVREEKTANDKCSRDGMLLLALAGVVLILRFAQKKFYPSWGLEALLTLIMYALQMTAFVFIFARSGQAATVLAEL